VSCAADRRPVGLQVESSRTRARRSRGDHAAREAFTAIPRRDRRWTASRRPARATRRGGAALAAAPGQLYAAIATVVFKPRLEPSRRRDVSSAEALARSTAAEEVTPGRFVAADHPLGHRPHRPVRARPDGRHKVLAACSEEALDAEVR